MAKHFPLQTLLDLSQMRMDEAARRLGELLASEQEADKRLELLQQYREEYRNRFVTNLNNGVRPNTLDNYRAFLGRLDDAIEQARLMAIHSRQRTAQGQQEWLAKRGRVRAYDTLAQRHLKNELKLELRKEQKQSDEHATRKFLNTREDKDEGEG